jgi:hypothetical protein
LACEADAGQRFTADLAADDVTTHCKFFFSRYLCPGSAGANLFVQNVRYAPGGERHNGFCYPPYAMVGAFLHYLLQEQATFTLVVPESSEPWWPVAWHYAARGFVLAEAGEHAISVYQGRGSSLYYPLRTRLWALRFEPL